MPRQVDLGQIVPNIQVGTTTTGLPSTPASVENVGTDLNPIFDFTIPKGDTGATPNIQIGDVQTGDSSEVTRTGTDENPILNFTLEKGETGNGIASIAKTSTSGLVDTYTITFTNGQTTTYQITNGANGNVVDVQVDGTSVVDNGIANIIGLTEMKQELEDMYNLLPKVQGTGETITLDGTVVGKMLIDLKGNTSQETTTGKNLLNNNGTSGTKNGVTYTINPDKSITLNGTSTQAFIFDIDNGRTLDAGTYTLSLEGKIQGCGIYLYVNQTLKTYVSSNNSSDNWKTNFTLDSTTTFNEIRIDVQNSKTFNNVTIYPMIRLASITDDTYEPYTNGPSPNPDYPQDIHVVSGDNSIEVVGKNLFNPNVATSNCTVNNGFITITSNSTDLYIEGVFAYNEANRFLTLPSGSYYMKSTNPNVRITFYGTGSLDTDGTQPRTLTEETKFGGIRVRSINGTSLQNVSFGLMLATDNSSFEPYQGASYPITLPEGMFLGWIPNTDYRDIIFQAKTGDTYYDSLDSTTKETLDYGKWYVNKQIGKVIINENSGISRNEASGVFYLSSVTDYLKINSITSLANYYKSIANVTSLNDIGENQIALSRGSQNRVFINDQRFNTVELYKTWLSTHNTIVYYVLNTPTITEITDSTLLSQLEALNGAKSYTTQTNISQENNDKPFILDVTALKQLTQ